MKYLDVYEKVWDKENGSGKFRYKKVGFVDINRDGKLTMYLKYRSYQLTEADSSPDDQIETEDN